MSFPIHHTTTAFVLYGSETGNAQDLAEEVGRMLERLRFSTYVTHLNAIDPAALPASSLVIITISTTGQGDFPSNASVFWKRLLRKRLPSTYLEHIVFAVFGLGDSSYPKYNYAARKLHKRILQLGASEFFQRGEADEQQEDGSDATFVPWLDSLRQQLITTCSLKNGLGPIPSDVFLEPRWRLLLKYPKPQLPEPHPELFTNGNSKIIDGPTQSHHHTAQYFPPEPNANTIHTPSSQPISPELPHNNDLTVSLIQNQRITPATHFQDVRHLIFTTPQVVTYLPGDVLTIYPQNPDKDVQVMLDMMEWAAIADEPLFFQHDHAVSQSTFDQPPIPPSSLPNPATLRTLLTNALDINTIPRRSFFSTIAHFTKDETQRSRLLEFASPELSEELYDYATRPRRSILETLHDFHTVRIPFEYAATVLPTLRGRQFSISSGGELLRKLPQALPHDHLPDSPSPTKPLRDCPLSSETGTRIDILMALVSYRTVLKRLRQGTCSRYIASLPIGTQLRVTLQRGSFGLKPSEIKRPVLLVGPGTGLAPMRALIWQRKAWAQSYIERQKVVGGANGSADAVSLREECVGETVLVFGARSGCADYFFEDEWASLVGNAMFPFKVLTAFSRDSPEKQNDLKAMHNGVDSSSTPSNGVLPSKEPTRIAEDQTAPNPSNQIIVQAKPYVQSVIRAQAELIYDILHNKGGKIFVSGSAGAMPRGVREAVVDVFEKIGAQDRENAEREVRAMEQAGRWVVECW